MKLGNRIKKFREKINLSQEELADKVYTSRQTISNWENDKTYPDVNSLKLLSNVFDVSLDNLLEGDIEKMKRTINETDRKGFIVELTLFALDFFIIDLFMMSPKWGSVHTSSTGLFIYHFNTKK